jgi:hypothetical protein
MFRFTIRDLLWLMVVVAVACMWWVDHNRITPTERQVLSKSKAAGYEFVDEGNWIGPKKIKPATPVGP